VPTSARLLGRVLFPDELGKPARIWSIDARAQFSYRETGDEFTLDALSAGKLELFFLSAESSPPSGRAALRASLEIAEGETRRAEFRLERGTAHLSGRLVDEAGRPVSGAGLLLELDMLTEHVAFPTEERKATTDPDGRFEFPEAFAGHYQLRVADLPGGLLCEPFEDDLDLASGETRSTELRCAHPIELAGRVDLTGRDGVALDPAHLRVVAHAADDGAELAESIVAADGAFRLPRLFPTEIELRVMNDGTELGRLPAGPGAAGDLVLRLPE